MTSVQGINPEQVDILRKTLFKGFTDDEIGFCLAVCSRTGLDPFVRQIHFTKRQNFKTKEWTIVITTGIDGFRLTANRSQAYAGSDEPVFKESNNRPIEGTVTVYKIVQGVRCGFTATARWAEYYPGDGGDGFMWRKMPFTMLGKCAEAQALRKAFPAELSNIYSHEEMAQSNNDRTLLSTKAAEVNQMLESSEPGPDLDVEAVAVIEETQEPDFLTETAAIEPPFDVSQYVIPIGQKYKGKRLSELSKGALKGYLDWVKEKVMVKDKTCLEFIKNAETYLERGA